MNYAFDHWLKKHPCNEAELWKIQNCFGMMLGFYHPLAKEATNAWMISRKWPMFEECKCYGESHHVCKDGEALTFTKHHIYGEEKMMGCKCERAMTCETCYPSYCYLPEGDLKRHLYLLRKEEREWRKSLLQSIGFTFNGFKQDKKAYKDCGGVMSYWHKCVEDLRKKYL